MYSVLIFLHAIIGILLIVVILLQSGRSGGLTETFGGAAESIFGTKTNAFMVRATTVMAILFITSCLVLAYLSKQQSKSLMERAVISEGEVKEGSSQDEKENQLIASEEPIEDSLEQEEVTEAVADEVGLTGSEGQDVVREPKE